MGLRDPAGNGKAQSGAAVVVLCAGTGYVSAEKALENARLQISGDATPSIRDAHDIFVRGATAGHGDASALRGVLDRIIQQIEDHAAQQGFVGADGRLGCILEMQRNLFCERQGARRMHTFANKFIKIKIARLERILAGVGAREGEEILDDVGEPLGLVVKHCQRFAVFLRRTFLLRKSDLRFTAQNRNRRSQDWLRRSNRLLNDSARCPSSSLSFCTARRSCRLAAPMRPAWLLMATTGARLLRARKYPPTLASKRVIGMTHAKVAVTSSSISCCA